MLRPEPNATFWGQVTLQCVPLTMAQHFEFNFNSLETYKNTKKCQKISEISFSLNNVI